jgi:hypothetical protein
MLFGSVYPCYRITPSAKTLGKSENHQKHRNSPNPRNPQRAKTQRAKNQRAKRARKLPNGRRNLLSIKNLKRK